MRKFHYHRNADGGEPTVGKDTKKVIRSFFELIELYSFAKREQRRMKKEYKKRVKAGTETCPRFLEVYEAWASSRMAYTKAAMCIVEDHQPSHPDALLQNKLYVLCSSPEESHEVLGGALIGLLEGNPAATIFFCTSYEQTIALMEESLSHTSKLFIPTGAASA